MPKTTTTDPAEDDQRAKKPQPLHIISVLGPKGGVGKTLVSRALICRFHASGFDPRIVQIDKTPALPALYGNEVIALALPSAEAQRADPLAAIMAFEPCADAIDACLADGRSLVTDVGGGPTASGFVEFVGKSRLDAHIAKRARAVVFMPMVAESATMTQTVELGLAVEKAFPSASLLTVLNERDGKFKFFPGSAADKVMQEKVRPFIARHSLLTLPAVPAGALAPFEALGLTFLELIQAEPEELGGRLGMSRTVTAMLQGDVAEWLTEVWTSLDAILPLTTGGVDG